jgi:molecular chaperone DnaK (HSP70)
MARISININKGALELNDIVVGIDLGTTNSLVAYVDQGDKTAKCVGIDDIVIVPSIVYLNKANTPEVGDAAKQGLVDFPESTIFSVKRLLGKSYKEVASHASYFTYRVVDDPYDDMVRVEVNGKYYTAIELSSFILRELKQRAEKVLKVPVTRAVITVPAYFNDSQRQGTRDAGKLAGLDVLRIVNEPTAASLAYGIGLEKEHDTTILVYDFGGGTFDVSVLWIQDGVFEVLSTQGDTYLGGDDIDRSIVNYWLDQLGLQLTDLIPDQIQMLRLLAEKAKMELSHSDRDFETLTYLPEETPLKLSWETFDGLVAPFMARTEKCVKQALLEAKRTSQEIDSVVLVGGSTRLPQVKRLLAAIFGKLKINDSLDPDQVVAIGAAVEADILAGNRRDFLLLDVIPLSLGIETSGGLMDVIISRNSKIPGKAGRQYTTSVDGQVNMKIAVYQGERELVAENRKLGEFELNGIPPMPAGLPKVEVTFLVDADGILKVSAIELRSGIKQDITIKPQNGLTDEMVELMLQEGMANAKKDFETRLLLETITEAKQLKYTAERFMENNKDLLKSEEYSKTMELIRELSMSLETDNKDIIMAKTEALNEFTRPFAERLMDSAIGKALKGIEIK